MGRNARSKFWTFHNASTAIGNGYEMLVGAGDVQIITAVTGNAAGFTLVFEGKANDNDDYTPWRVVNCETGEIITAATNNGKYKCSIEGLVKFRTRLLDIVSGALTSKGTVID